jgi:hypothetical protein
MASNYLKYFILLGCLFVASCTTKQIVPDDQLENYGNHDFGGIELIETETVD